MKTYLSIDVGTSSTKLSLFDEQGRLLTAHAAGYPVNYPQPEWAEQDPDVWWKAVCQLGPEIMKHPGARHLEGISVSGQTPLGVPVDEQGRPLRNAILWLDRRAVSQVDWLRAEIGEDRCREVSANRLDSYFGGPKWLWFRQEEPHLFDRTWKILQANSFVTLKLTGKTVIDPAQAGLCSPCFNFEKTCWDEEICASMGIPVDKLPEIHPAYEVIGHISPSAARLTGLPEGTPVVCGGADFACACLGAGVTGRQSAAMMLGTAGNLMFPGIFNPDARLLHTRHLTGEPLTFGGVMAGGNLNWFASLIDGEDPGLYRRLDDEAAQVPPGSEGLIFLPYLMGERTPIWDPGARGAFIGLSSRHTRAHLYRAVLEGVAFAFRQIADITGSAGSSESSLERIVAIDGGARSSLWRSILASMLNLPVCQGGDRSGTALGSVFLAALGTGGVSSFDAITSWVETEAVNRPDPLQHERYNRLNEVYTGLYEKLKPDFDVLGSLS